ncbi:MipA/OmpV family protein [Novosphingobium panipatense]
MLSRLAPSLLAVCAALLSMPLAAQEAPEENVLDGDHLTVGVGAIYLPSYRGSDDYRVQPVPLVRGRFKGIDINPRPAGVALDFIPDDRDSGFGFSLGPVGTVASNRNGGIKDDVVRAAGKLDVAIELGASAGVTKYKLLHEYDPYPVDRCEVGRERRLQGHDLVTGDQLRHAAKPRALCGPRHQRASCGRRFRPLLLLGDPGAKRGERPSGLQRQGWMGQRQRFAPDRLRPFGRRAGRRVLAFGVANYSRMLNDGKDTPFTSLRGSANQWLVGAGVAYTF